MSSSRASQGGADKDTPKREKKEKDEKKDKAKKDKKKEDALSPGMPSEKRVSPRGSSARSGAGELRSSAPPELAKESGKKNPDKHAATHKTGDSKLRERRVTRIQALVRQRQAVKVATELQKEHKSRTSIVTEILSTEKTYVGLLRQVVEVFITPLREMPTPLVTSKDIRAIFLTNELLYSCHSTLLAQLEQRFALWSPSQAIGDVLLQLVQFLGVYTSYAVFYSQAIDRLNGCKKSKAFSDWIDEALKKVVLQKGKVVDLPSLLITPVQRITRYSLLFMDLLKHTAIDHRDYNNLSQAFSQVKLAVETIEASTEEVQAMEQTRYLMDNLILKKNQIVPPNPVRRWLRDGGVKMLSTKHKNKLKRRWIILFSDVLLLTEREEKKEKGQTDEKKKKEKSSDGRESPEPVGSIRLSQFRVRKLIPIDQMLLRDGRLTKEAGSDEHKHVIEVLQVEPSRKVALVYESNEARQSWFDDLATALELFQNRSTEEEMEVLRQSEARAKALRAAVYSSPTAAARGVDPLLASSRSPTQKPKSGGSVIGSPLPQFPLSPELSDSGGLMEKPSIYTPVRRSGRGAEDKRTSIAALTLATLSPQPDSAANRFSSARVSSDGRSPPASVSPSASGGSPSSGSDASPGTKIEASTKKRLSLDRKALSKLNPS